MHKNASLIYLFILLVLNACTELTKDTLFQLLPPQSSGLEAVNSIESSDTLNVFKYRNFYNGGGVAIGDINNDGLADVYLSMNTGSNKLFLNKGDFNFEDVTDIAKVGGNKGWSTGVVMVDINNDGWLDIYVCNAGLASGEERDNELFINNQDGTFVERAADYNLADSGITTHAAFLIMIKMGI